MTDINDARADQPAILINVEVMNGNDFPIEDLFDGVPIVIGIGQTVLLSPQQAAHCFGYPGEFKDMARHMSKRYGWNSREYLTLNEKRQTRYEVLAEKITFTPVFYDLVRRPNEPIPALAADDESEEVRTIRQDLNTGVKVGRRKTGPASRRRDRNKSDRGTAYLKLGSPR